MKPERFAGPGQFSLVICTFSFYFRKGTPRDMGTLRYICHVELNCCICFIDAVVVTIVWLSQWGWAEGIFEQALKPRSYANIETLTESPSD